jgi:hemerythrin superfamily protein
MAATATSSRTKTGQDIIAQLKQDHKDVKALFEEFEGLGPRAVEQRRKLGTKITTALAQHSEIEKQVLYPAFKARAEDHDELQQVLEAFEEHALVDGLVEEIQNLDARDETYEAKVNTLMDVVLHHVKEEESEMFPTARELFAKDELVSMAAQAQAYRR